MSKHRKIWSLEEKQNILLYSSTHGVGSASREFSVSSACIYKWKERLSKMGTSGLFTGAKTDSERELKRLERENRELKRIVAEKELALQIKDALLKKTSFLKK